MEQKRYFTPHNMALIGVLAAMVFAMTYIGIDIPTALGKTKLHFGNVMCLLSALLLGPVTGGLAAGIGSALFDLTDPVWATEAWITFINKFAMAFVAGLLMQKLTAIKPYLRSIIAALCGALTYSILYIGKNTFESLFIKGFSWEVTKVEVLFAKVPVTVTNGVLAVICAVVLYHAVTPALKRAHILPTI